MADLDARVNSARIDLLRGHTRKIKCLAWNKTGSILASGSADSSIRLWSIDPATGQSRNCVQIRAAATAPAEVECLAWSTDDANLLASGGADRHVRLWDARSGRPEQAVPTGSPLYMGWHPDGHVLAVGTSEDRILFLDVRRASIDARKAGVLWSAQQSFNGELNEFAWSPSGLLFYCLSPRTASDTAFGNINVAKPRDGFQGLTHLATLPAHTGIIQTLRFDPQRRLLASSSGDSTVQLWSADDLAVLRVYDKLEFPCKSLSFSHDGALLATASDDRFVDVVRVADCARVRSLHPSGEPVGASKAEWAPHAHMLAYAFEDKPLPSNSNYAPPDHCAVRLLVVPAR